MFVQCYCRRWLVGVGDDVGSRVRWSSFAGFAQRVCWRWQVDEHWPRSSWHWTVPHWSLWSLHRQFDHLASLTVSQLFVIVIIYHFCYYSYHCRLNAVLHSLLLCGHPDSPHYGFCPSVCHVRAPNSKTKGLRRTKNDTNVPRGRSNQCANVQFKKS